MGYRTVVILDNDTRWQNEPKLGEIIAAAAAKFQYNRRDSANPMYFKYGSIAEVQHNDVDTLMVIGHQGGQGLTHRMWSRVGNTIELVRAAADNLGFNLHRKRGT